jgi:hypothetical protein
LDGITRVITDSRRIIEMMMMMMMEGISIALRVTEGGGGRYR